jgi:serine protease DegQ
MFKFTIIALVTGTAIVSFSLILFNSRTIEPSTAQSLHQSQDTSLSLSVPELPPLKEEIYLPSIPQKQLLSYVRSITVKVISEDSWGSGVIIKKQDSNYTVLTNHHVVLDPEAKYQVETPDGRIYEASLVTGIDFEHYDLSLLQFQSVDQQYQVATLGNSTTLDEQEVVIASGFPFGANLSEDHGFRLTEGKITLLLGKTLENGYQIGYTNPIQKGMSGGPVVNLQGEVVAISGLHAYPLWGASYIYDDGEQIASDLQQKMVGSSWGISINSFLELAHPFLSQNCQAINSCNSLNY